jgi:uncharacterized protein (DUF2236 family)
MSTYYFNPNSVFWRVNSDSVTMLSASRALMLELAHPMIAAGVSQHSNYQGDPFGRLLRTLRTMTYIMFTDTNSAKIALRHFNGCHTKVKGTVNETTGPVHHGTAYTAQDPMLKLWVLATLYDSCLVVYNRFVSPLSLDDKREYYRDGLILGGLLGIPRSHMPATYDAFDEYMQAMINSDLLTPGETARKVVNALFAPPLFGPFANAVSWPGLGLLPTHVREGFGFKWNERDEKWLNRLAGVTRGARPWLPRAVAANPRAVLAEWRFQFRPKSVSVQSPVNSIGPLQQVQRANRIDE